MWLPCGSTPTNLAEFPFNASLLVEKNEFACPLPRVRRGCCDLCGRALAGPWVGFGLRTVNVFGQSGRRLPQSKPWRRGGRFGCCLKAVQDEPGFVRVGSQDVRWGRGAAVEVEEAERVFGVESEGGFELGDGFVQLFLAVELNACFVVWEPGWSGGEIGILLCDNGENLCFLALTAYLY